MDPSPPVLRCADAREAVSARHDGEPSPIDIEVVDQHLDGCEACARYAGQLGVVSRRARVAAAESVPDLTEPILARVAAAQPAGRRVRELRWLVGLAGLVQVAVAVPALLGTIGVDQHLGRDLGALQLALAVGFLLAAWQPARAIGVLPVAAVVAVVAVVTAGIDVAAGAATLTAELTHLSEVVGVLALWALRRRTPASPVTLRGPVTVRPVPTAST